MILFRVIAIVVCTKLLHSKICTLNQHCPTWLQVAETSLSLTHCETSKANRYRQSHVTLERAEARNHNSTLERSMSSTAFVVLIWLRMNKVLRSVDWQYKFISVLIRDQRRRWTVCCLFWPSTNWIRFKCSFCIFMAFDSCRAQRKRESENSPWHQEPKIKILCFQFSRVNCQSMRNRRQRNRFKSKILQTILFFLLFAFI